MIVERGEHLDLEVNLYISLIRVCFGSVYP